MESLKKHITEKNYVAGLHQFNRLLAEDKISEAYLAADADEAFKHKVLKAADAKGVTVKVTGSCREFASLCKIRVGCAVIGITRNESSINIERR